MIISSISLESSMSSNLWKLIKKKNYEETKYGATLVPLKVDINKINAEIIEKLFEVYKINKNYNSFIDQPERTLQYKKNFLKSFDIAIC